MNLSNKVSQDDVERVNGLRNHPQFEDGFDDDSFSGGDDLGGFDDDFNLDDLFGDSGSSGGDNSFGSSDGSSSFGSSGGSSGFGSNNGGFGSSGGGNTFGSTSGGFGSSGGGNTFGGFGSNNNGFGGGGNPFGSPFGQQQVQQQQPDTMDKILDSSVAAAQSLGTVLMEMVKSLNERSADDYGYLGRNLSLLGCVMVPTSIILGIIGGISKVKLISFAGLSLDTMMCGGLLLGTGMISLGASVLVLSKIGDQNMGSIDDIPDEPVDGGSNAINDYEENIGDELDDLFGDDFDNLFDSISNTEDDDDMGLDDVEIEEPFEPDIDESEEIDFNAELEKIQENTYLSRETLFNTFKSFFPKNTPAFADKHEIDPEDEEFGQMETICIKALANLANTQIEDIDSHLEKMEETFFSYELRLKRINKVKKTEDLAREIEVYVRDSADEDTVNASVSVEGDFYKIIITKGESAIVTFGDVFRLDYCCDFFLNTKNKLPIITGIDELGRVILDDAKNFDTMLIAGKPRSGKSWYVLSILISMMLFNTPEDVQFIIIDPKEANLFKKMSLMPHVCGLHNDAHILDIFDDIIENEAPRRKKLVDDNEVDDIWALRDKKGIRLPLLYIVIDEYISVINNMDKDKQKEFNTKFQVIVSQFPSLGIRIIFVPHRAMGVVDKTNRTLISFYAAVRADTADVIDTLGIPKWTRALTMPGDIAVKSSTMKTASYVRGAALTTSDSDNSDFIEKAAQAFYKMGVEMPDMTSLRVACNRDENYIKERLNGDAKRIQYDASAVVTEIENE